MTRPPSRPGDLIVRRRWLVLLLLLLITAAMGLGLRRLRFDFSPEAVFETGGEEERRWRALCRTFGKDDAVVTLVVRHAGGVLRREVLAYVDRLTHAASREPFVARSRGLTTVRLAISRGDELRVGALGRSIGEAQIRGNPLLEGLLVNDARTATSVVVELAPSHARAVERMREATARLRALASRSRPPPGVTVQLYGLPDMRVEGVRIMRQEQRLLLSVMVAVFGLVLLVLFGWRVVTAVAPLLAVALTLVWTLGLMGHSGMPLGMMTSVLPLLLFAIGISDAIHLLSRYREELAGGADKAAALPAATSRLAAACLVTSVTTAVGFASLISSRTSVLVQFGWIAAAGVMFAYAATILQVPVLLSFVKPLSPAPRRRVQPRLDRWLSALSRLVLARPGRVLALTLAGAALLTLGAASVRLDVKQRGGLDPSSELALRYAAAEADAGGLVSLVVGLRSDRARGLRSAAVLRRVWALQRFIEEQPGASRTLSPASLVRELKAALKGRVPPTADPQRDPNLPDSDEQLAQLLLVASMGETDLPWERYVTSDWRQLRITARFEDRGSRAHAPVFAKIERRARALFADQAGVTVQLSGQGQLAVVALHQFIEDLLLSLLVAAAVIFVVIGLLFRSWRTGLISVVPNLLPLYCAMGYMGLRGIPLNGITVVAFPVALGLVVDDTIHFLARYREERRAHPLPVALERTLRGAGRPIVATTGLLALGISAMLLSFFLASQQLAEVLIVAVVCALPADLLVLPALLRLWGEGEAPAT